ncbi:hypothetical protein Ocin01_00267, partial [Orchesella cincta]
MMNMNSARIVTRRGLKPSDRFDPNKRAFINDLTQKILHLDDQGARIEQPQVPRPIDLKKIFTPALDAPPADYSRPPGIHIFL